MRAREAAVQEGDAGAGRAEQAVVRAAAVQSGQRGVRERQLQRHRRHVAEQHAGQEDPEEEPGADNHRGGRLSGQPSGRGFGQLRAGHVGPGVREGKTETPDDVLVRLAGTVQQPEGVASVQQQQQQQRVRRQSAGDLRGQERHGRRAKAVERVRRREADGRRRRRRHALPDARPETPQAAEVSVATITGETVKKRACQKH